MKVIVANGLSEKGKRQFARILADRLSKRYLDVLIGGYLSDVQYNTHVNGEAHIEIGSMYTQDKTPFNYRFTGDELELEAYETDED